MPYAVRAKVGNCLKLLRQMCCALLLGVSPAYSQTTIPHTPAGQTLTAWLEAFNSGELARIEGYCKKFDPGQSAEDLMAFRARTGGFNLIEIHASAPLYVEFLVDERASDTRAAGKLEVQDAASGTVKRLVLRAIPSGAQVKGFTIDAITRARVIEGIVAKLNEIYVFPKTARRLGVALRKRKSRGEYDGITDGDLFADRLTVHLQEQSKDKHLRVTFNPARSTEDPSGPEALARLRKQMQQSNCGFQKLEYLPGNVGYLKFNMFGDPETCGSTVAAAMGFLAHADALVFDLRENSGGNANMVALIATYLFSTTTHLNDIWERKGDKKQEYWTRAESPDRRLEGKPVYLLTSRHTFSAAEGFSFSLKNLKRATLVGETTGGGAHPTRSFRIDERFVVGVPYARAFDPITKGNWEGIGVQPDVKVPAAQALATAQKLIGDKFAAEGISKD